MPKPPKIDITGGDINTGKLTLSDGGRTEVGSNWDRDFRKIKWKTESSVVKEFKLVGKTASVPFVEPIPDYYDDKVKLTVRKGHPDLEWEYCIHWIDNNGGGPHKSDPIISISPSYVQEEEQNIKKLILILLTAGLAILFALKFWDKKRK